MRSYRVGVVGLRRGLGPARVFDLMPDCRVVAGCDISPAALEQFGPLFPQAHLCSTYDEMLAQGLDIVFVASPVPLHCQHTVAALEAGLPRPCRRSRSPATLDECRQLLAAVQAHPAPEVHAGRKLLLLGAYSELAGDVGSGSVGRLHVCRGRVHPRYAPSACARRTVHPPGARRCRPFTTAPTAFGPLHKVTGERCVAASGMSVTSGSGNLPARVKSGTEVAILQTASGGVNQNSGRVRHHA